MKNPSVITLKSFVVTNILIAAILLNLLFFASFLKAGGAFTAGLEVGVGVGWILYLVLGLIELRRPGRTLDERQVAILTKACAFAFCLVMLAASVLQVLLRSESLGLALEAKDCASLLGDLGLASFLLTWAILSRKS